MKAFLRASMLGLGLFAALNLAALAMLTTWLLITGRMDGERFDRLRRIVSTPVETERLEVQRAALNAEAAAHASRERERLAMMPRTSEERLAAVDRELDRIQIRQRLMEDEARLLSRSLDERLALAREQQAKLERDERAFTEGAAQLQSERSDAQFKKTVELLESASPKQAKEWLIELASTGRRNDAVRYLDSMSRFAASRVMRELKSAEETALAADLLEALRRRTGDVAPSSAP